MPKVKIFENDNPYSLEQDINKFIKDEIIVINISYSAYMCGFSTYRTACILYETGGNK